MPNNTFFNSNSSLEVTKYEKVNFSSVFWDEVLGVHKSLQNFSCKKKKKEIFLQFSIMY